MRNSVSKTAGLVFFLAAFSLAQTTANSSAELKNPLAGNAQAIEEGRSQFRFNCALCHGVDAHGTLKGPNLTTGRWVHGGRDGELFHTIQQGVPGTLMPAQENILTETETWQVISYLDSLQKPVPLAGNVDRGREIFVGNGSCLSCHMVNGHGGRLGPDLSRVGAERSTAYLAESIRQPSAHLAEGIIEPDKDLAQKYQTVTAITKDGRKIVGVALNEDSFSLQMMGMDQNLHLFVKSELRELIHSQKSLMPPYPPETLTNSDLQDLVAYLASLRGQP